MGISAIQTEYNGYKFRSRLEARWAVFFDAMDIEYQYEPEGFEMPDGTKYLPDFYLSCFETYAEVKPFDESRFDELKKCASFVLSDSTKKVIILGEIPNFDCPVIWYPCFYKEPFDDRPAHIRPVCFGNSPDCLFGDHYVAKIMDAPATLYAHNTLWYSHSGEISDYDMPYPDNFRWSDTFLAEDLDRLKSAYKKARQARFEFGETPKVENIIGG